jgi:hypothetical protein
MYLMLETTVHGTGICLWMEEIYWHRVGTRNCCPYIDKVTTKLNLINNEKRVVETNVATIAFFHNNSNVGFTSFYNNNQLVSWNEF